MTEPRRALTRTIVEKTAANPERDTFLWDARLPGFGLRIYPSGARQYIFQYRTRDRRERRVTIGKHGPLNPERAREIATDLYEVVRRGGDPATDWQKARSAPTIAELCARYLAEHAKPRKKTKSADHDAAMIEQHIIPALGAKKVHAVSRADVSKVHYALRRTPYQANRVLALLSKMMNLAEQWGLRPDGTNPCRHVERFPEKKRRRFLSDRELCALSETLAEAERAQTAGASAIAAVRLLLFTGARMSEILTLRWEHVDWEQHCLRLPDSKTGAKVIHLNAPAREVLSGLGARRTGWVIQGRQPDAHLTDLEKPWRKFRCEASVRLWLRDEAQEVSGLVTRLTAEKQRPPTPAECFAAARAAHIELPPALLDVRLHDLRHSFASVAVAGGLSLPLIGALLGHTQPQTTARYAHLADDPLRRAADLVGQRILAAIKGGAEQSRADSQDAAPDGPTVVPFHTVS